ncbi:MAG: hypothetical protein A3J55_03595 [Candidatus Ryanbacteria bacterium RIFCSPHIGHO2_02_FULL_45_17b]|uniref:Uncharacterized protein n=1 Tax=Candidatus Ryanbacteria bacterium RIFCSPHIGHO2_01_FULL_45_22 TaxID=1802114 RepID=A0A1G2G359_9BACT|nr:MAG: hypothetical protein A2719_04790 [Candidatus Ryanbacteria bacterium RIFCSPHIGHO2_01_FULL_45_22]OGZ47542.1 MAG: hypothetical protein A3J55_03595 [Candidatus Ryanbacteria bacterium RIFCSPHIGHO2_02_FULL_45_17b]
MAKVQEKARAVELRKKGYTYKEIMKAIPTITSKGTLSDWCNQIILTTTQLARIEKNMQLGRDRARFKSIVTNRKNRELRDGQIAKVARMEFELYKKDPFFTFGLALYCAEGAKTQRHFQFMNSDTRIIQFMIRWVEIYLKIPKQDLGLRLYIHKIYQHEHCEKYWEKEIGVSKAKFSRTIFKPTPHKIKKNPNYKGCFRVDIGKVAPWLKVMTWESLFNESMRP